MTLDEPAPGRRAIILTIASASVFAIILGVAVGFITTFTHRQYAPWGLVAGLAIVAALVAGLRLVFESRVVAIAGAVGVLGSIALLTQPGAGGSVLVIAATADGVPDPLGWIWAIAPAIISVVLALAPFPGTGRAASRAARARE